METGGKILVVDDDLSVRQFLTIMLERTGHRVKAAASGAEAFRVLQNDEYDLVITDLKMPDISGLDVIRRVKELAPQTEVIMITAFATTDSAVEAMKNGAFDYVIKPFKIDELRLIVDKALTQQRLASENRALREELRERDHYQNIIGTSDAMHAVFDLIERVKDTRINILITGESGTGKELVARAIHVAGKRSDAAFLGINCGAIPESLIESELFGHRRGAFTGAVQNKKGLFEAANNGTLFLDEIGELPLGMQVKLLRALQERKIKAVGGLEEIDVDVRIIAATNRDLQKEVAEGRFREDLFYRLNVVPIPLPPLRDRRTDIPALTAHFAAKYADEYGLPEPELDDAAFRNLLAYDYPGNVRELENIIERVVALGLDAIPVSSRGEPTQPLSQRWPARDAFFTVDEFPEEGVALEDKLSEFESKLIGEALRRTGGKKKEAAKLLGLTFRQFRYKLGKVEGDAG